MLIYETIKLEDNKFTIKVGNTKTNKCRVLQNTWGSYDRANFWTKFFNMNHSHISEFSHCTKKEIFRGEWNMIRFLKVAGWVACLHSLTAFGLFIYAEVYDLFSLILFSVELAVGIILLTVQYDVIQKRNNQWMLLNYFGWLP